MGRRQVAATRAKIDRVDSAISALVSARAKLVTEAAAAKRELGLPARDLARETAILDGYESRAGRGESRSRVRSVGQAVLAATRHEPRMVTIVGQAPSRSSERPFDGKSGARLASLLGTDHAGLERAARLVNVLDRWPGKVGKGDRFPMKEARARASKMRLSGVVILAGKHVAHAFGIRAEYFEWVDLRGARVAIVPHPSGVNRWWNAPGNRALAERFLREVVG